MQRNGLQKCLALLLLLCMALSFSACSRSPYDLSPKGETRTVVDCLGREVKVPVEIKRVSCLYASTSHMMAMLDKGELIISAADGVRRDALMLTKYPDIAKTSNPYNEGAINIEELAKLEPDVVLMKRDVYERESEREKLDKIKVPYLVVDYYTIDELKTAITVMGNLFEEQDKAEEYLKYMDDTFSYVTERVKDIPEDEIIHAYHSLNQATVTDIERSFVAEVFRIANVGNVAVEAGLYDGTKNTTVTLEEIYNWDPDVILCNEYLVTDYIKTQPRWASLRAVTEDRVYTLPIGATRWCHHGSMEPQMGALYLAQLIYPDRFTDLDLSLLVHDYYLRFFGLDFDDETVEKILTGRGMRETAADFVYE